MRRSRAEAGCPCFLVEVIDLLSMLVAVMFILRHLMLPVCWIGTMPILG